MSVTFTACESFDSSWFFLGHFVVTLNLQTIQDEHLHSLVITQPVSLGMSPTFGIKVTQGSQQRINLWSRSDCGLAGNSRPMLFSLVF